MKRRQVVLGLGAMAATSGAALGTGAFSSTAAGRRVTISVADDAAAFLGLDELGDGGRSEVDGGTVQLFLPSLSETSPRQGGDLDLGLGPDSVYEFSRDVDESGGGVSGLIEITNQSADPIRVYSERNSSNDLEFELYDVSDPERSALRDSKPELDVGSKIRVGVRVRTFGADVGEFDETIRILAEEVDS